MNCRHLGNGLSVLATVMLCMLFTAVFTANNNVYAEISNKQIPADAVSFNGHYYYVYDREDMDYEKAVAFLKARGGYLASITSAEEDAFAFSYIRSLDRSNVLFGLTDLGSEGSWKWQNGETFSYSNWGNGEPNGGSSENFGMYYQAYPDGSWNDGQFDVPGILCEWDGTAGSFAAGKYKGHKYQLFDGAASWAEAKEFCKKQGGYLAVPNNKNEDSYIYSYIRSLGFRSAYFGVFDKNGSWKTVKGKKASYTNWAYGEPNDYGECYAMYYWKYPDGTWNDGAMSDYTDNGGTAFICEWDYAGKTYTVTLKKNGGDVRPTKVVFNAGEKVKKKLPVAGRKGYKFNGWYTKKKGGTKIDKKKVINKNYTLYAQWTKLPEEKDVVKTNNSKAEGNSKTPASSKKSAVSKSKKWSISEAAIVDRYAIPGIGTTPRVPQGLCLTDKYILISCYNCYKGDGICDNSEILVLNRKGKFLTSLILRLDDGMKISYSSYSHVGGLTYDPDRQMIYIADSDEYSYYQDYDSASNIIWKLPVSEVEKAVKSKKTRYNVIANEAFIAEISASCVTYYDGYIYVGEFSEKEKNSYMQVFYYDAYYDRYVEASDNTISIPLKTQGIAFRKSGDKTYAYFSTSYGRSNNSKLIREIASGYPYFSNFSNDKSCALPNMSENIAFDGSKFHVLFESGAYKYICEDKTGLFPLDKVLVFDISKLKFK